MAIESSPVFRAVWDTRVPVELFACEARPMPAAMRAAVDRSLAVVERRRRTGALYDARHVVSSDTVRELAGAGCWGLGAEAHHGGSGAGFAGVARAITEMARADPWIAGMMSTHAAQGPLGLLEEFGTPEQKDRLLPRLARGERLGAFAITELATSADWTRVSTTARRDRDRLLLTGEKLFIINAAPGRTVAVLCRLEGRLEVLVAELPAREDERFRLIEYGMRAPAHIPNVGLRFHELPVPAANLLVPRAGDGATIAHRALDRGRVATCAVAAGLLREIAGVLIPWVQRRETFGAALGTRELVQRRLGRLAGRIVACDAMSAWTAALLDDGYRGELECAAAKVFASEALKEAAVDILLKTQGGRALLDGTLFADTIHDLLAPTVYEGENELLTLGSLTSLARAHGEQYLSAITRAARAAGFERLDLADARQLWAVRRPLSTYIAWVASRQVRELRFSMRRAVSADAGELPALAGHVLRCAALEISAMMRGGPDHQVHQARAHEVARRVQDATVMLVVIRYADRQTDPVVAGAARCMAMELGHALLGARPSARYLRELTNLGAAVAEDRFAPVAGAERSPIPMSDRFPARWGGATRRVERAHPPPRA